MHISEQSKIYIFQKSQKYTCFRSVAAVCRGYLARNHVGNATIASVCRSNYRRIINSDHGISCHDLSRSSSISGNFRVARRKINFTIYLFRIFNLISNITVPNLRNPNHITKIPNFEIANDNFGFTVPNL